MSKRTRGLIQKRELVGTSRTGRNLYQVTLTQSPETDREDIESPENRPRTNLPSLSSEKAKKLRALYGGVERIPVEKPSVSRTLTFLEESPPRVAAVAEVQAPGTLSSTKPADRAGPTLETTGLTDALMKLSEKERLELFRQFLPSGVVSSSLLADLSDSDRVKYGDAIQAVYRKERNRTLETADEEEPANSRVTTNKGVTIPENVSSLLHAHTATHQLDIYHHPRMARYKAVAFHVWGPTGSDWGVHSEHLRSFILDPLRRCAGRKSLVDRLHLLLERYETSYNLLLVEVEKLTPSQGKARLPHALVDPCHEVLCDLAGCFVVKSSTVGALKSLAHVVGTIRALPSEWDSLQSQDTSTLITCLGKDDVWKKYSGSEESMGMPLAVPAGNPVVPNPSPSGRNVLEKNECANCRGKGHMAWECVKPCTRKACKGTPAHIGKDCPLRKKKQ